MKPSNCPSHVNKYIANNFKWFQFIFKAMKLLSAFAHFQIISGALFSFFPGVCEAKQKPWFCQINTILLLSIHVSTATNETNKSQNRSQLAAHFVFNWKLISIFRCIQCRRIKFVSLTQLIISYHFCWLHTGRIHKIFGPMVKFYEWSN